MIRFTFLLFALLSLLTCAISANANDIVESEAIIESLTNKEQKTRGIILEQNKSSPSSVNKYSNEDNLSSNSIVLRIVFQFDSATLTHQAIRQLRELGKALSSKELLNYRFTISGHTDSVGSNEYNLLLSLQRAEATKSFVISNFNVHENKITTEGFGEQMPLLINDPTNSANRRVVVEAFIN